MSIGALTDFMQATFIERTFSHEDHDNMVGVVEEVVYYVKDWAMLNSTEQDVTMQQGLVLLKFGHIFDVQDLQYWKFARSVTERCLKSQSTPDLDTLFKVAFHLLHFDFISNTILRLI